MSNQALFAARTAVAEACEATGSLARYFRITSRSHHGLVLMVEIARASAVGRSVSIRAVAETMHLSEGYLEELAGRLRGAGLIRGSRGRLGGYVLVPAAADITMGTIVRLLDGPVVLAHCQDATSTRACPAESRCASRNFFGKLKSTIDRELDSTTLADLVS
ncbi:Rrf2 family transcriptional regulator [Candidatus Uhrbacteria bacterium]|nr:Rrf2 family transcriptional regulator [Candidatus Uhrbacteria bacterium]